MSVGTAVEIMRSGIFQVMMLAAPVLIISMIVGLTVSIFQATTSIQEQTLTFVPKIAAIFITLMFFGEWMLTSMREYAIDIIMRIPEMVR
ncbi:MAG: flagellar biosynthesis protein FliQ [Spirochaetales bacterium]|nr:flagellar biosynthesis protein FliQ [Spirochaetales bacterium]